MDALAQAVISAIDSWAGGALVVDKLGATARRVRIGDGEGQALYFRAIPADHQELYLNDATDTEIASLKLTLPGGDLVYPYSRGGGKGALIRVRELKVMGVIGDVIKGRAQQR